MDMPRQIPIPVQTETTHQESIFKDLTATFRGCYTIEIGWEGLIGVGMKLIEKDRGTFGTVNFETST